MLRVKVERVWVDLLPDEDADASYLEQEGWEDRLEAYRRGDFAYVGVRACAELRFETESGGWIYGPIVKTPGVWGVESDSGKDYFRELGEEEAYELRDMLIALGVHPATASFARRMASLDIHYV